MLQLRKNIFLKPKKAEKTKSVKKTATKKPVPKKAKKGPATKKAAPKK